MSMANDADGGGSTGQRRTLRARRALRAGLWLAALATPLAIGLSAHAADDTAAIQAQLRRLTEQMQALERQSQQRIDALKAAQAESEARVRELNEQILALQKNQPQPGTQTLTMATPPGPPSPDHRNVVVTQQPGNLPGRSTVPPYTTGTSGAPGGGPPVAAAPVSSGADRIKLCLSGQIDRMLL